MNEFEQALRRADLALGGDSNIGLPYWDWMEPEVNGEVIPGIVREMLLVPFEADFFPVEPSPPLDPLTQIASERAMYNSLVRSRVPDLGYAVLRSTNFLNFSCTAFQTSRSPSIEAPHNSIHGMVGGLMGTFQSAFHPIFWLHHCNVDRILEKYLELEIDTERELRGIAQRVDGTPSRGFPDGPYGRYLPFTNYTNGNPYHASDCFVSLTRFGVRYDQLPPLVAPQIREPPWLACFKVDVLKVKNPCLVHIFVSDGTSGDMWSPPSGDREALMEAPSFAGTGAIFFLDSPAGCENCKVNPVFDLYVDITAALRSASIMPSNAQLHVLVEKANGDVVPIDEAGVPTPKLCGPKLSILGREDSADMSSRDDIKEVQAILAGAGYYDGAQTGERDDATVAALKKFQEAMSIDANGVVGHETRKALLSALILGDDDEEPGARLPSIVKGGTTRWTLDLESVPPTLKIEALLKDLEAAFSTWAEAAEMQFVYVTAEQLAEAPAADDVLTISFGKMATDGTNAFDGPGGQLAHALPASIVFDASERWELSTESNPLRKHQTWDEQYFQIKPVALHEIGHCLGLEHSPVPNDVMSAFYDAKQTELSPVDVERIKDALA